MIRKPIIGVMGGDHKVGASAEDARQVGALIARQAGILLTGGRCINDLSVKNAAMMGADDESHHPDATARLIGILPKGPRLWEDGCTHRLFLKTGLHHIERDIITGVTPDVQIFFSGSSGTLCELAFALTAGRPVLLWRSLECLRERQRTHLKDGELDKCFIMALQACRTKLGMTPGIQSTTTTASLQEILAENLAVAKNFDGDLQEMVAESFRLAGSPVGQSGFTGFREDPESKGRFEAIVERISNAVITPREGDENRH